MTRGAVAVLALAVCAIGLASGHASLGTTAPHPDGVLVYAKAAPPYGPNSPENVWAARLDGSHPTLLGPGEDPAVSPNGRWIAFGRGGQILVMPVGGGPATVLETLHGRWPWLAGPPVWAPDSRRLAAIDGAGRLLLIDRATGRVRDLAQASDVAFSPDSRELVYEVDGRTSAELYVVAAGGGKARRIASGFGPVWGRPGIAFDAGGSHGDVWLADPSGRHARRLTHTRSGLWPSFFSADGKRLLAANPAMHNGRLWAVDVRTGAARPLTPWVGDLYPQGLSRNGRTVLAAVGCGGMVSLKGYVETIPFAGGKPKVIARGPCRASWDAG